MEINAFYLMNKNRPLTMISFTDKGDVINYSREYRNKDYLPVVSRNDEDWLYTWWKERTVPVTRSNIHLLLEAKGMSVPEEYLFKNLGLSLNDCYWIKPLDSSLRWEDVNLYTNRFKDNTLQWDSAAKDKAIGYSPNSSLKGNVEKTWTIHNTKRYLIKGNKFHTSSESINEVIAGNIHEHLGYKCYTEYKLTRIKGKPYDYGCSCELFTDENTELVTAYDLICSEPRKKNYYEHLIDVCALNGLDRDYVIENLEYMILTDFVMAQTDRHFDNIGFLRNTETLEFTGFAPIYDSGESFYANTAAPDDEKDLPGLFTRGFESSAERTLKLVRNPDIVDLTKLPPASYIKRAYGKDSKDNEHRINGLCYAYEKKIQQCREYQLGKAP